MENMREMMNELKEKSGSDFDRGFIETMIIHHQQAVEMTEDARERAQNPRLREMAEEMHSKQQAEINEMEAMKPTL